MHKDAALVGDILTRAFLDDQEFRDQIKPCYILLSNLCSKSNDQLVKFKIPDSFNSHMVQSYHAAKTRELLAIAMGTQFPKVPQIIWDLTHSFDYQIVFSLSSAAKLFSRPVATALHSKTFADEWLGLFNSNFPGIKDTRDALAHDEDRILGFHKGDRRSDNLLKTQALGNSGMKIYCTDTNLDPFEFDFSIYRYKNLLVQLSALLTVNQTNKI